MLTNKPIYQVDAFTSEPFRGNPAGVCLLDKEMPDTWMQNVAAEMNLSETAFIIKGVSDLPIRFFTPESEIPLCGHATLASSHIIFETGIRGKNEEIYFLSKAGKLKIRSSADWITMNFPAYALERILVPDGIEIIIGARPLELYRTGHGWTFALLSGEKEVRALQPDFVKMKDSEYGDLIVTAASDDKDYDFCVRCFAPALGINEDPVTGSAHCSLVPFWNGKTGRKNFISHQVSRREGILKVELLDNRVEISGQAKTIIRGELLV